MSDYFSHAVTRDKFLHDLKRLEYFAHRLNQREQTFVQDIRKLYESRQDAAEFDIPLWSPTAKQLNYMTGLIQKIA